MRNEKTVKLDDVIIEVTRRCQLTCQHCLRGSSEPVDMDIEIVRTFLRNGNVTEIRNITFSGGEPSLRPAFIREVTQLFRDENVEIGSFYIATNAVEVTKEFIFAVMELWCYCTDNEISGLAWSNDVYHLKAPPENVKMLEVLSFAHPKYHDLKSQNLYGGSGVIAEGNAIEWGGRQQSPDSYECESYGGDDEVIYVSGGQLYVNCEGMVIKGCDFSYESQRNPENQFCAVSDFKPNLIEKWCSEAI